MSGSPAWFLGGTLCFHILTSQICQRRMIPSSHKCKGWLARHTQFRYVILHTVISYMSATAAAADLPEQFPTAPCYKKNRIFVVLRLSCQACSSQVAYSAGRPMGVLVRKLVGASLDPEVRSYLCARNCGYRSPSPVNADCNLEDYPHRVLPQDQSPHSCHDDATIIAREWQLQIPARWTIGCHCKDGC